MRMGTRAVRGVSSGVGSGVGVGVGVAVFVGVGVTVGVDVGVGVAVCVGVGVGVGVFVGVGVGVGVFVGVGVGVPSTCRVRGAWRSVAARPRSAGDSEPSPTAPASCKPLTTSTMSGRRAILKTVSNAATPGFGKVLSSE